MKGLRSLVATTLALFLVFSFVGNCSGAPQRLMERRNWTPQAMLYLRGAQGRRFISHQSRRKDVAERPPPERRSPNPQLLTLPEAAPVLMAPLQTHRKLEKEPEQMRFVEDNLLYW
nr:spexin [Manis javanica]